MARVIALRVQRGDLVHTHGQWREVKAVRSDRQRSSGSQVVLLFRSGPALRVKAGDVLMVNRGCRAARGKTKRGRP